MTDTGDSSFRKLTRKWSLGCCLLDAMRYGRWEDVKSIVKTEGVDPNILVPEYGIAPMHCAAGIEPEEFGVRCLQEFIKLGGNPNVRCSEGVTPVHVASCWGRLKVLNLLVINGGNPFLLDNEGNDAFYYTQGCDEHVTQFLKNLQSEIEAMKDNRPEDLKTEDGVKLELECHDMNSNTFSIISKHRQGIHLFEFFPEEDSSSTTTIDTEINEDFSFEPKEYLSVSDPAFDKKPSGESITTSDGEIYSQNIFESDISGVIKVIKDSVNLKTTKNSIKNNESSDDMSVSKSLVDLTPIVLENSYESHHDFNMHKDNIRLNSSKSGDVISASNETDYIDEGVKTDEDGHSEISRTTSDNNTGDIKSKIYSFSGSEKADYETLSQSHGQRNLERKSSRDSESWSENSFQLPKKVREKLLNFKVNTHYSKKVFRIISRSCDGFCSRKSLYSTGYEFWSTRVKSKSYPLYIIPRPVKCRKQDI